MGVGGKVLPSSTAYHDRDPRTCGHFPASYLVRRHGEKHQLCINCYYEQKDSEK